MLDLPEPSQPSAPAPLAWDAHRYLDVLHPAASVGRVSGLTMKGTRVTAHTWRRGNLPIVADILTEQEAYIGMNRFYGPRGRGRLAALNALWLDLDTYRIASLVHLPRAELYRRIASTIEQAGLPEPSLIVDSGRGMYVIWLLDGGAAAAEPRWKAVMKALVAWGKPLGADPACVDPARVLRLPGSWHEGADRQVSVVAGSGTRYGFDRFETHVWRALGRPERASLERQRKRPRSARSPQAGKGRPRGLPKRAFWSLVLQDLEVLLEAWGGRIPKGYRDIWLHVFCCALAWTDPDADILKAVVEKAHIAAPGLRPEEIRRTMRPTAVRAEKARSGKRRCDGRDPRYDYSGGRLADLLCVDRPLAEELNLRQIVPMEVRKERGRQRRTQRRRAAGDLPRSIWLALNPTSREKPWEAQDISRSTWYRRRAKARRASDLPDPADLRIENATACGNPNETGPALPYEGEAPPGAAARRPAPANSDLGPCKQAPAGKTPPKTTPAEPPGIPADAGVSDLRPANPSPAMPTPDRRGPPMPTYIIDAATLAAASRRLERTDLGALTRIAVALADGPAARVELARRTGLTLADLDRLSRWLRALPESGKVAGLRIPEADDRPACRGPRQGLLFEPNATAAPIPPRNCDAQTVRAAVIAAGIRALAKASVSEAPARSYLGKLLASYAIGPVAEAIAALEPRAGEIADPRAWLRGYISNHYPAASGVPARGRGSDSARRPAVTIPLPKQHPEATPEFLGISAARANAIREKNRQLNEKTRSPFRAIPIPNGDREDSL
jgi:hypothetical protein